MVNVTGWDNLSQGNIVQASYNLYSEFFMVGGGSIFIPLMFFLMTAVIFIRTRSLATTMIVQILFCTVFYTYIMTSGIAITVITAFMVIEFGLWLVSQFASRQ